MERVKGRLLLSYLVALPVFGVGQIDLNKAPWMNLPCETGETQTEMNICSGKKVRIADSVMTLLYAKILIHLDAALKDRAKNQKPDKYDQEYTQNLKNRIDLLKNSRHEFDSYRRSMTTFISEQYANGTIRPLMMNLWSLSLTEDGIKALNSLIEELRVN